MLKGMAAQTWKALPMCILTIYLFTSISAFYFPPAMVKVGTLISLNTDHGKQIKSALEYAIEKVNEDSRLLRGTALKIIMAEVNCSVLQSTFSAMQLLEDGVLALIGPQSSGESYFVAQMAEAVQVPLISFSATDPSLSQSQYSYFLRLVPSEKAHMSAIAAIIRHYGWNNVVALFYDDDFGWNTVMYLEESLNEVGVMIVRKAALGFATTDEIIYKVLADLRHMRSMVFVAYVSPQIGRMLLSVAMKLRMFNTDYAWIVNEDVFNILHETNVGDNYTAVTESAITTRPYIPLSSELTDFLTGFREKLRNSQIIDPSVSKDALYAHDALWVFAKALDRFMHQKKYFLEKSNVSESYNQQESQMFNEGLELLYHILRSKFTGVTGHIEFDSKGDRRNSVVEVVRGVGKYLEVIGYWSTTYGNLTLHPPSATSVSMLNVTKVDKVTGHVKHLSRNSKIPVDHKADRYLRIIIPRKSGFRYFVNVTVDKHNNTLVTGFCIDIFKAALRYLPYNLSYSFTPYGNGVNNPNYDEIIERVANKEFDAAVGDIAITTQRVKLVDFTLPYVDTGIVVAVPRRVTRANRIWGFLEPFTLRMWCTIWAFFMFTGMAILFLEHKSNEDFQGKPTKRLSTALWFILSTLFSAHKESVKTVLGRTVLIVWLFVVLILTSSYTANLTSILTIEQLRPTINGVAGLITSKVPIGYQSGSYVKDFVIEMGIPKERLIPSSSARNYTVLIRNGPQRHGVGAVVDERPYIDVLLSLSCDVEISGDEVYKVGWGFAFQKGSRMNEDFTHAFLKMTENGEAEGIHKKWLENNHCKSGGSSQFNVSTFSGLFIITGIVSVGAFCVHCIFVATKLSHDSEIKKGLDGKSSFAKLRYLSRKFSEKLVEAHTTSANIGRAPSNMENKDQNVLKRRSRCSSMIYKCQKKRRLA